MSFSNSTSFQWASASDFFSVAVSSVALFISVVTLWKTYLSPFKLEITHSSPTFCLYKVTYPRTKMRKEQTWWIPSFNIGLSCFNEGRKTGKIVKVRIVADLTRSEIPQTIMFVPQWIVRYNAFLRGSGRRGRLSSIETDWYPQIIPPGETRHVHVILEMEPRRRWDHMFTGSMKCRLEVLSSESKEWKTYATYRDLVIDRLMFEREDSYVLTET